MAIDWKQIWKGTHNFQANYGSTELRTPPWGLLFIWPLSLFPLSLSWGLAALVTLGVLVISVPKAENKWKQWGAIALLVCSYPALRQIIDGNLEALVIGGALLLAYSLSRQDILLFAISLLLLSAKVQETWLLLPWAITWQWMHWPQEKRLKPYFIVGAVATPLFLVYGADWIGTMLEFPWPGTAIDSSLKATMQRLGLPQSAYWGLGLIMLGSIFWLWRAEKLRITRSTFGLLTSAALLLGPYAASNSGLTPFALGIIPLALSKAVWGLPLGALYFLPYIMLGNEAWRFSQESNFWTLVMLLSFIGLFFDVQSSEGRRGI